MRYLILCILVAGAFTFSISGQVRPVGDGERPVEDAQDVSVGRGEKALDVIRE